MQNADLSFKSVVYCMHDSIRAVQMQRMVDNKFSSMLREVKAVNLGLRALLRSQPLQHSLVAWVSDCAVSYSGCQGFLRHLDLAGARPWVEASEMRESCLVARSHAGMS